MAPANGIGGLGERLKDELQLVGRNADTGIAYGECEVDLVLARGRRRYIDGNAAILREFDGITNDVEQHLPHVCLVTNDLSRNGLSDSPMDFRFLLQCQRPDDLNNVFDESRYSKWLLLHFELSGLNAGDIQDVVYQPFQHVAR